MENTGNNESYKYKFNSKGQKASIKTSVIHCDLLILFKEIDLNSLIEEFVDNKNENDNRKNSWIKDYNSFLDEENKNTETKID